MLACLLACLEGKCWMGWLLPRQFELLQKKHKKTKKFKPERKPRATTFIRNEIFSFMQKQFDSETISNVFYKNSYFPKYDFTV